MLPLLALLATHLPMALAEDHAGSGLGHGADAPSAAHAPKDEKPAPVPSPARSALGSGSDHPEPQASPAPIPLPEPGTLVVAIREEPVTMDPALAADTASLQVAGAVYETLFQPAYARTPARLEPMLAGAAPSRSDDGLRISFRIRPDARYSDDRKVVAADFVRALQRIALPELGSPCFGRLALALPGLRKLRNALEQAPAGSEARRRLIAGGIDGVSAPDEAVLRLDLDHPLPRAEELFAQLCTAPVPPPADGHRAPGEPPPSLADLPPGTGPFKNQGWSGRTLVLARNPHFHPDFFPLDPPSADGGLRLPLAERIELRVLAHEEPALRLLAEGRLHILPVAESFKLPEELARVPARLVSRDWVAHYLAINHRDPVLGRSRALRQAISSAIDRKAWMAAAAGPGAREHASLLPPEGADGARGGAASKPRYGFDLERARKLLARAGYPGGKGLPVFSLDLRGNDERMRRIGALLAEQLARVGIRVEPIHHTVADFLARQREGAFQLAYSGWVADGASADAAYERLYGPFRSQGQAGGPNTSGYDSPAFNALYLKLLGSPDGRGRADLLKRLGDLVQEDCPLIPGFAAPERELVRKGVNARELAGQPSRFRYLRARR